MPSASDGEEMSSTAGGSMAVELAMSVVLPGTATFRRSAPLGAALFVLGVGFPGALVAAVLTSRGELIGLTLDPTFLLAAITIAVLAVLARFAAVLEVASEHRDVRGMGWQTAAAGVAATAVSLPLIWVAVEAGQARSAVTNVFVGGSDQPLFSPEPAASGAGSELVVAGGVDGAGAATGDGGGGDGIGVSGVDPSAITTVLVLGGDAGPGRWGMRTDTMILVMVHEASGRTALVSIPRNLEHVQFPPGTPLAAEFPEGFDDLTNAVFTHVNTNQSLVDHYGASGLQAEAVALAGALGYSLDVEIDDFALVNMQGFADVVDAIGGVTVELERRVPLPPSIPGAGAIPRSIGPGFVDMNGAVAIGYARARYTDSDYQRMGRQRQLLAALGSQVSATEALGAFTTVADILEDSLRTSLSSSEFNRLLDRFGDNSAIRESVGLTPPLIRPASPDWVQIRGIIDAVEVAVVTGEPSGYGA